jgi:hypothetical protein
MSAPVVFYAWQSDRPKQIRWEFIKQAANSAVNQIGANMHIEKSPRLDHDTENESGAPGRSQSTRLREKVRHHPIESGVFASVGTISKRLPSDTAIVRSPGCTAFLSRR